MPITPLFRHDTSTPHIAIVTPILPPASHYAFSHFVFAAAIDNISLHFHASRFRSLFSSPSPDIFSFSPPPSSRFSIFEAFDSFFHFDTPGH
jgi:hypothetical protein